MSEWFHVKALADGVWQLTEPGHVASWLVAGDDRAALIDTGCGFAPIRPVVEALTDRPVTVVQTHHHLDHIGGTHEFDDVLIHPLGVDGLASPVPAEVRRGYLDYALRMQAAFATYRGLDRQFFHLLEDHQQIRPLPDPAGQGDWWLEPVTATGTLEDGDAVDLGSRALRVLHTPGHSPDSICLDLVGEGILFGGDTVNTGPVYAQMTGSDVGALRASLVRLAEQPEAWERIFCSHFLRTEVGFAYLGQQVDALSELLLGAIELQPAIDCIGGQVQEAVFDGFSFLVPAGWTAPAAVAA